MMIKKLLMVLSVFLLAVMIGFVFDNKSKKNVLEATFRAHDVSHAQFKQAITSSSSTPLEIVKLYDKGQLLGVVSDREYFNALLDKVYHEEYAQAFPNSKLGLNQDVYLTIERSFNVYENIDDQLFNHIYDNGLIAVEVEKISFSNGAIIYVKNIDDFLNARKMFILGYISEEAYELLINNQRVQPLTTYGQKETGFDVVENITISKDFASIEDIYLDETSILNFLSFGYSPVIDSYQVQDFDTIEGIAWLNQMSPNQLLSINKNVISDVNQVLRPGIEINVAVFNSPLTVRVTKQRLVEEKIYPASTIYREDPGLREGLRRVEQQEVIGAEDVLYEDVFENDVAISSTRIASTVTRSPVQEIIYIGTYEEPKIGSGRLQWPMYNARVSCGWYCYGGHAAIDIQSRSNRGYGPIYAADRGVIVMNQYHYGYGYYVVIDHNNGMRTSYAHMESRGYLPVGATVRRGEQIGYVGMTGRTTGPHVHFEVYVNGSRVNPCRYLGC